MFQLILPFQLELPFQAQPSTAGERRRRERRRREVPLPPDADRRNEDRRVAS